MNLTEYKGTAISEEALRLWKARPGNGHRSPDLDKPTIQKDLEELSLKLWCDSGR